jgi:maltose O-acetyltransferase
MHRVIRFLRNELGGVRPRLLLVQLLVTPLPRWTFGWVRTACYRLAGLRIGPRTRIMGKIDIEGTGDVTPNVRIGELCLLNSPLYLNASAPIRIGNRVGIGHHVVIITDTHHMGPASARVGERFSLPVSIEDGVWIAACVTILPGVTIGRGSAVAAGAVVAQDVPPNSLVGGVPARRLRDLS